MQYFTKIILAGLAAASAVVARPQAVVPGIHFGNGTAPFHGSSHGNATDTPAHGNQPALLNKPVIVKGYKDWTNPTCYW